MTVYAAKSGVASALPFTGLAFGWKVLVAATLLFAGIALLQLVRPAPSDRP